MYIKDAHGYDPEGADTDNLYSLSIPDIIFASRTNLIASNLKVYYLAKTMDLYGIDFTPQMHNITVPSLVVWGKLDKRFSVELAYEGYDALGSTDKYLEILPSSGHSPLLEDIPQYQRAIIDFIEKHKSM